MTPARSDSSTAPAAPVYRPPGAAVLLPSAAATVYRPPGAAVILPFAASHSAAATHSAATHSAATHSAAAPPAMSAPPALSAPLPTPIKVALPSHGTPAAPPTAALQTVLLYSTPAMGKFMVNRPQKKIVTPAGPFALPFKDGDAFWRCENRLITAFIVYDLGDKGGYSLSVERIILNGVVDRATLRENIVRYAEGRYKPAGSKITSISVVDLDDVHILCGQMHEVSIDVEIFTLKVGVYKRAITMLEMFGGQPPDIRSAHLDGVPIMFHV